MSPDPGYGPGGFMIRPTGLTSWEGNEPPRSKPDIPVPVTEGLGNSSVGIPRNVFQASNETLRVKDD